MKALSFWPPWLDAILRYGKRVENRQRWSACYYRGPLLLHASKGYGTIDDFDAATRTILDVAGLGGPEPGARFAIRHEHRWPLQGGEWRPGPDLVRGAIVGRCRIAGFVRNDRELGFYFDGADPKQRRWWFGGFALILSDVEAIETPIPYKGAQGFFEVPDDVIAGATWKAVP